MIGKFDKSPPALPLPAPWVIGRTLGEVRFDICTLYGVRPMMGSAHQYAFVGTSYMPSGGSMAVQEANLHLIAAAPDLLAALQSVVNSVHNNAAMLESNSQLGMVYAALEKALPQFQRKE